ncbi:DUF3105 domain-containing protein [Rubrobacter tropicus]|uniref:DUF3105 domain-containing protein n=1 Tax=Rubrobacter tropicus TaxID=2653851 RepID=A0A6G8QDH5_9ACTN|nr:DUF3105 domain-containing protein [Rubrobacter tropicus]QIN84307.1 DUF3105 domain-containing protein [Rubrobacter tropicus]
MGIESSKARRGGGWRLLILACVFAFLPAACGGETSGGTQGGSDEKAREEAATGTPASEQTTVSPEETTAAGAPSGEAAELAKAKPSPREIQNMLPADGKKPDPARPLPEDPPEGIEVYPPTTNELSEGPIKYDRSPPTNGRHDPLWQNCGVYEKPIKDRHAVHSLDHGVVWITHQPDLPANQTEKLRSYGAEDNVIVSPYPGQDAPVTVTSWRVQLKLEDANDPGCASSSTVSATPR